MKKKSHQIIILWAVLAMFAVLLSGCEFSLSPATTTPTSNIDLTVTSAIATVNAGFTQTAESIALSATATSTITLTPTSTTTFTYTPSITPSITPTETPSPTNTRAPGDPIPENAIVAYFVKIDTGGPVGCGDTLVPILTGYYRTGNTVEDLRAALNYLFSASNYVLGLYNATYTSSLQATEIEFHQGQGSAITKLTGSYNEPITKCDAHRYRAQVWSTAYQFDEIKDFTPYVGGKLLGDRLYAVMLNGADE